jgi:hypothetical protein
MCRNVRSCCGLSFGMDQNQRRYNNILTLHNNHGEYMMCPKETLAHLGVTHSPCPSPLTTHSTILLFLFHFAPLAFSDLLHPGHLRAS